MGANTSKKVQIGRKAGEYINKRGYEKEHSITISGLEVPAKRFSICRCWQSAKFPFCDNAHQILQRKQVNCGPVMLEIRRHDFKPT
ncbi:CDGSH iron-sulfur domain-containing protein, putative [Babesia microti strain RI]|uniref:CDGSH iron-sulfur domain-containing protein, putative n=1 Tax=Babesia microti (strain RI) TaxID=1133968 RepID=A0A1R4AAX7_BABMR|nr:CDGSH iron-sulfur domain-containing protein, putative [Babesia microti strain RI]SJK86151.1 CDGSH iron-sulfur domain-containing protein, putative [Babesia microti strain RI]|eukprot:XP_021338344.1 CDGSH iron-sulfur domain-containing protein, putative [Babesia microti strain RI]